MAKWPTSKGEESQRAEKEVEQLRAAKVIEAEEAEATAKELRKEIDIVKRARALFTAGMIDYPDVKKVRVGDMFVSQPQMTDENKWTVLQALFGDGGDNTPHRDHFRGRIVDHEGRVIDDQYPVVRWVEAFSAAGLKGVSAKGAREAVKEWAMMNERNDLINHVEARIPEWDGKERMRTKLIEMFDCRDTELNRDFGQYFWLSLYSRVMMPGSLAPIVLSLFGAQGCGKSRFSKAICKIITGNEDADSVQLNLDGDKLEFLRNITGQSVIASVGEMTGFTRGDLNKIKDFITRPGDQMHYKFEGTFNQMRQWITVMDGNRYEGMQRDDSGNRRFYPMFCGQLPDKLGKPAWRSDFAVSDSDWESFEDEVWQLMAEAAHWFDENGLGAYEHFVVEVIKAVKDFSNAEMERDSGTIGDDVFEVYLVPMLKEGPKCEWQKQGEDKKCVGVRTGEFKRFFMDNLKHVRPNWKHLRNKMYSLGAVEHVFSGGYTGYLFPKFESIADFNKRLGEMDYKDDGEEGNREEGKPVHEQF
jgi:hypothetical protein